MLHKIDDSYPLNMLHTLITSACALGSCTPVDLGQDKAEAEGADVLNLVAVIKLARPLLVSEALPTLDLTAIQLVEEMANSSDSDLMTTALGQYSPLVDLTSLELNFGEMIRGRLATMGGETLDRTMGLIGLTYSIPRGEFNFCIITSPTTLDELDASEASGLQCFPWMLSAHKIVDIRGEERPDYEDLVPVAVVNSLIVWSGLYVLLVTSGFAEGMYGVEAMAEIIAGIERVKITSDTVMFPSGDVSDSDLELTKEGEGR